ncbi:acyltransferase [Flammeovirga sp. SJP92]|uniref:acyltransferase family protein n=1 Tax=Flammeovirga sp. SJP92 TaxID=1775430 RepID=UPI000787B4AE|nr:acyltransferase [Flammeovirga sp. SJP92]KXX67055.1 hypothetical protein AVL50_29220 [Flammeovirga sp. SJP92]
MTKFLTVEISKKRIYGLDILRAIAILLVVISHGKYLLPNRTFFLHDMIDFDGVSIFFVLSGFLIGGILIQLLDQHQPTKTLLIDFWTRRWLRTLPNYFLILFILCGINVYFGNNLNFWVLKDYMLFSQNLFSEHPNFFPEAWSLSIEEWFYLITPLCLYFLILVFKIKPKQAIITLAFTILTAVLFFRFYRFSILEVNTFDHWDLLFRKQVVTRLDSLMFGVICAYIQYYSKSNWLKYKKQLLLIGIAIFVIIKSLYLAQIITITGAYNCVFSFSVISLATAFLLPYFSDLKSGEGIIYKGVSFISLISYSMYLLNLSVVQLSFINVIPWRNYIESSYIFVPLKYGLYWGLTVLGSVLIYKFYELPIIKWRDKIKINKEKVTTKTV